MRDDGTTAKSALRKKHSHIACGDRVTYEPREPQEAVVLDILPRRNSLKRLKYRGKPLTLACNIDQILIVVACKPVPQWELIDQLIGTAIHNDIALLILAHKSDLSCFANLNDELDYYAKLNYAVLPTSLEDARSMEVLSQRLHARTNVLLGQSGMGKSSLTERLVENSDVRIGALSARELGKDTTTVSRCYPIGEQTYLIDSPGIRNFVPASQDAAQIGFGFHELSKAADDCRFSNCRHINEPDCAVLQAVTDARISERRYASYRMQLNEHERQKNQGSGGIGS